MLLVIALAGAAAAPPAAAFDRAEADARIAKVLKKARIPAASVGFVVLDPEGRTLWEQNADALFVVASNNKLVTTAAALSTLGLDHVWETSFGYDGTVRGGTLDGRLWVRGSGDPGISGRDHDGDALFLFRRWAEGLSAAGIQRVTGGIVLDDSAFAGAGTHPTWLPRYVDAWFGAESSALVLSDGCVSIRLRGPGRAGLPVEAAFYPETSYVTLVNSAVTARRRSTWSLSRHPLANIVYVAGQIPAGQATEPVWIPVRSPTLFFGAVLRESLERDGLRIEGPVERGQMPPLSVTRRTLDVHTSRLLDGVVVTNKRSQNLYAELILKTMGAARSGVGTFETGTAAVADWLSRCVGVPSDDFRQVDGSGLSYENRFRPRHLAAMLEHMARTPEGDALLASLPISGVDGTLRSRFSDPDLLMRIRAKTGFLAGVSGLSGYLETRSGRRCAFSILVNEDAPKPRMEAVEEGILREVFAQVP